MDPCDSIERVDTPCFRYETSHLEDMLLILIYVVTFSSCFSSCSSQDTGL